MKKTVKIILTMLLTLCMVIPMLVMSVSAAEGVVNDVNWVFDEETGLLTFTANGATASPSDIQNTKTSVQWADVQAVLTQIKEVKIENGTSDFKKLSYGFLQTMTALTKVTMPSTVTTFEGQVFNTTGLKELIVEGNAYIPGAADLSNVGSILGNDKHRTFESAKIEALILKGGLYSDSKPIITSNTTTWGGTKGSLGTALKTIMGPMNDTYLRSFAAAEGYDYVPYGKIGEGTAWTYNEATKTITIYGNGTSSALTAISEADAALLKDAECVVVRNDITSIAANAFAGLANLEAVIFEGNVPVAEADPFGGKTVACYKAHTATVPETGYWAGKTVTNYNGEYDGTIPGTTAVTTPSKWEFNLATKTLTISNTATSGRIHTGAGYWSAFQYQIEHVVISGRIERITQDAFKNHTALKTVVLPSQTANKSSLGVIFVDAFKGCTNLTTISLAGNVAVPGVADLSEGNGQTNNYGIQITNTSKNSAFTDTAIEGIIMPVSASGAINKNNLPQNLKYIYVKYNDAKKDLHEEFCAANPQYTLAYYEKLNSNTNIVFYYPDTETIAVYGDKITYFGASDETFLNAKNLVIGADVKTLSANVFFEKLTSLETIEFEGNAPATDGNPFGEMTGLTVNVPYKATGFDETWQGYPVTVIYPNSEGTFISTSGGTTADGTWKFDIDTKTLSIWSTSKTVYLPILFGDSAFKEFAGGDYAKDVAIVNFFNEDKSVNVSRIDGQNTGLERFASLGLTEIEEIYFNGSELYRITRLFNSLDKLTTFGMSGTEIGTIDLSPYHMNGGDASGSFSGQDGIKKVILPMNNIWGDSFVAMKGNHWANIPAGYFKGMTGLCEVVLNGDTTLENKTEGSDVSAYFRGTCMIGANAFEGCTSLKSLTIPAGAPATALFRRSNNTNEHSVKLLDPNSFTGSSIETLYIWNSDASVVAEYDLTSAEGMDIYCANDGVKAAIDEDITANVSCIFVGDGISVRYHSYNGLRFIYKFDNTVNMNDDYTLVEYGAMVIAEKNLGESALTLDPSTFEPTLKGAVKTPVWSNGEIVGKYLNYDETGYAEFALTLKNFENNWTSGVYSCSYAVYSDANGNNVVVYEDFGGSYNIYDTMVEMSLEGVLVDLICDDIAVWDVLKNGGAGEETVVNENVTAMLINDVTGSEGKVLVVRNNNGGVATAEDIAAAKAVLNAEKVIALDFKAKAASEA